MQPTPNLRPTKATEIASAAAAFAGGAALSTVVLLSLDPPADLDLVSPWLFVVLPLSITPFLYVVGFLFQEAALPRRSRVAQIVSAAASGLVYVLSLIHISEPTRPY